MILKKVIKELNQVQKDSDIVPMVKNLEKNNYYFLISKFKNNILENAQQHVEFYFGSIKNNIIGNQGPDTWMEGNILILDEIEFNKYYYELGVTLKKISIKK